MPDLSIIIVSFNTKDLLKKCLHSIYTDCKGFSFEVIVVDDCSKDKSIDKVKEFIKSYKGKIKIKVIKHNKNRGKSEAMKTGIKQAKGDYILLTDSDSYFDKDALKKIFIDMNGYTSIIGHIVPYESNLLSKMVF